MSVGDAAEGCFLRHHYNRAFPHSFLPLSPHNRKKTQLLGPAQTSKCSFTRALFWLLLFRAPKLQITVVADSLWGGIYLPRRRTILHPHNSSVIANHFPAAVLAPLFKPDISAIFQRLISLFTHAIMGWRGGGRHISSPAREVTSWVDLESKNTKLQIKYVAKRVAVTRVCFSRLVVAEIWKSQHRYKYALT